MKYKYTIYFNGKNTTRLITIYSWITKLSSSLSSTAPLLYAGLLGDTLTSVPIGSLGVEEAVFLLDVLEILKGLEVEDTFSWEDPLFPDCFLRFAEFLEVLVIEILDDIFGVPEP